MDEKQKTIGAILIAIIAVGGLIAYIDWYSNHTLDGVLGRIRNEDFVVERDTYPNDRWTWVDLNATKWEVHSLYDFISLAYHHSYWSVSFNERRIWDPQHPGCIYWEPHYADSDPFYDIWFYNGTHVFVYTYYPPNGLGDN